MKLQMLAATAAVMIFATVAAAQDQAPAGGRGAMMKACGDDMQKFCPGKTGAERHQCMMDNKDKLSDGCKTAAAAAMQRMKDMQGQKPQ